MSFGYGRGRPVGPVEVTHDQGADESVLNMTGPSASSTPIAHAPHLSQTPPQVVTTDTLGSVIADLARQISSNITATLHTMHLPSNPQTQHMPSSAQASHLPSSSQPQLPNTQNVTLDPTQLTVVVQPEARPPPLFRGDQSETFSIHEWEDMMKSYMNRTACNSDSERTELIMSRLAGRARDVVKVSLRSSPRVSSAELNITIFDILKRNFSEITFSSMPMKDFYGTVPRDSESAMDYWIRLNKAIDVADECLRRRGKGVEDPSAEVVMMFICHCPDPSLAMSFQFKPVELWTASEVQERLDGHVRSLRSTAARAQHAVNISTWSHESTAQAPPHCGTQHQPPVVVAPPLAPPMPAIACAPVPSQPLQTPGWAAQSHSSPVPSVPTVASTDANVQQVAALFDKVLSLCTASLANADQTPRQPQSYSRQPRDSSRRPRGYSGAPQHSRAQPSSPCAVCGDGSHTTFAHCQLYRLCLNCHKPGHFRNQCPLPPQHPAMSACSPTRADLN